MPRDAALLRLFKYANPFILSGMLPSGSSRSVSFLFPFIVHRISRAGLQSFQEKVYSDCLLEEQEERMSLLCHRKSSFRV